LKNKRIKVALAQAGLSQAQLADILGVTTTEMSIMLKYELAVKEQNDIVARIREFDALRKRGA
jgi:predicted XRE-type DNA-binding protein